MKDSAPRLGEIGLANYPPYLMNRIMGRYNAAIRAEMAKLGLTTPKMRALAVLSVMDGQVIGQLAVHAIVEQSTLSRAIDALETDGMVRRAADGADSRLVRVFITEAGRTAFHAPNLLAAKKPDPPPKPGPGWVDAPMCCNPRTAWPPAPWA